MANVTLVGAVEVISLLDVDNWTIDALFPQVGSDVWDEYMRLYPDALTESRGILTTATAYLIRSPESTILVDTGLGPGPHEGQGGQTGQLLVELKSQGIAPEAVDLVVHTHLHRDHVGWNAHKTGSALQATFARARYLVPSKDWELYSEPEMIPRAAHLEGTRLLYEQGRVELVEGERAVTANVSLLPAPGHTPGHQVVMVVSQGERAAIIGDLAHAPPQVEEVGWSSHFDRDPEVCAESRGRLFEQMEALGTLVCAGHFPHPGFGYLTRVNGRRIFQSIALGTPETA